MRNKYLPTYEDCINICSKVNSPFYESKMIIHGYNISVFNYRLAQYTDFTNPIDNNDNSDHKELRGLTFVFNTDGSVYKRFLLLEKFFNLNQAPESMYSVVRNYPIKNISNKEDGSIASFIELPNKKIIGKTKAGFNNSQSIAINRLYKNRSDINKFINWSITNDLTPIFEYVSPENKIVLDYTDDDLILLKIRDNNTGKHLDTKNYLDIISTIKIAPTEECEDLDKLIDLMSKSINKEGVIVHTVDNNGDDLFYKIKTPWYIALHGLMTNDIYRENIIIEHILNDNIDDILGQLPENNTNTYNRIIKIIDIVKKTINDKISSIEESYETFIKMGKNRKEFALLYLKTDPNFPFVIRLDNGDDVYDMAKDWLRKKTNKLNIARDFLKSIDSTLFFEDILDDEE
jgi:T4 RnlA family RNA ligase